MPLESLLQLVETLRERIESHRAALSQSEWLTRYALIDPLLRELGWDTSDPMMVIPEYKSGNGSADYALLSKPRSKDNEPRPVMMVEAKKLGTPLDHTVQSQVLNYCIMIGTNHFSITDGVRWEIYDTRREGPINEKRVVAFDLTSTSASEASLKALALWRPSVQSGTVTGGSSPVLISVLDTNNSPPPTPVAKTTPPVVHHSEVLNQQEWQNLSDVSWVKGHPAPVEIRFPDNSTVAISSWNRLMIEPVRWLTDGNFLTSGQCPIKSRPTAKRYLVAAVAADETGKPMVYPVEVNRLHVELNYSARDCVRHAKTIVRHVGLDPADFKVRFS